jgi:hypothetical protein
MVEGDPARPQPLSGAEAIGEPSIVAGEEETEPALVMKELGLVYRNLHRERLVGPARKGLVNLDFVCFGFCFEGVAAPAIDEAFDIERNVTL